MNEVAVLEVGREALWVVLKTTAPLLLSALLVGITIALFQALTSIQEMTLTFVPKIVVIFVSLMVFLPFMIATLVDFGQQLFGRISTLG